MAEEADDPVVLSHASMQIGNLLCDNGDFKSAFKYIFQAFLILKSIKSHKVKDSIGDFKTLRTKWGADNFDTAWKNESGEDVPEWLK